MVWKGQCRIKSPNMKRAALLLLALVILFLSAINCDSYSYNIFGDISGTVIDTESGSQLQSAIVTLVPGSATAQTDADGKFAFTGLDSGQYTVSVQKNGYQPNRKTVMVISDETVEIVIPLTVIPQ